MGLHLNALYIEDDSSDVELVKMALQDIQWEDIHLHVIEDGAEAISYLQKCNPNGNTAPQFILLDLNLPKTHGFEVLKFIRSQPSWKDIPVIVVSTSNSQKDVEVSKSLGANVYLTKPSRYSAYKEIFRSLQTRLTKDQRWPLDTFLNFNQSL